MVLYSAVVEDGKNKICFNPYLESAHSNGVVSNCIQCHSHAVFHDPPKQNGMNLGLPWRDGTPASRTPADPSYFADSLQLDFMWSLASHHDPSLRSFLTQLENYLKQL